MAHMVSGRVSPLKLLVSDRAGHEPAIAGIEPARASRRLVSDEQIAALEPPAPPRKWDKRPAGGSLYLWISQGGSKLWRWHFALRNGKQQTYSIGAWGSGEGEYLLAAAISEAAKARALVEQGINPVQHRNETNVSTFLPLDAEESARRNDARERANALTRNRDAENVPLEVVAFLLGEHVTRRGEGPVTRMLHREVKSGRLPTATDPKRGRGGARRTSLNSVQLNWRDFAAWMRAHVTDPAMLQSAAATWCEVFNPEKEQP